MSKKHKWYDVIMAYANGEQIQLKCSSEWSGYEWVDFEIYQGGGGPNFENPTAQWRVKPKNNYSEIIENVLREIDFEKIHMVMLATNHTWYNNTYRKDVIPSITDLKEKVSGMVAEFLVKKLSENSTGGFTVKWYRPVDNSSKDTIQVKFQPICDVYIPVKVK
jgi:hypothetical protein